MTSPSNDSRMSRINPSPTVHNVPPEKPSVRRLTSKQVGVIGTVIVDLILAQVALALGGINILGIKPFAFLTTWGQQIQANASAAYTKAMASEAVANSSDANSAIALGQVAVTQDKVQTNEIGLQTTWNNLWEASYNTTLSAGTNKTAADLKTAQGAVRQSAVEGASGALVNGQNIQGTWDAVWNGTYNTNVTGKDLTAVRTATGAIVYSTNIAGSASQTNAGNIQDTWNKIYLASGGTGGGNRSLADAQLALGGVKDTAYRADDNVYDTWDEYFLGLYGWKPSNPTSRDFGWATTTFKGGVEGIEKKFDPLIPTDGGQTNSGNSISDVFTSYTSSLPNPPWTVNYPAIAGGYGSGSIGVNSNKQIVWVDSGLSVRRGVAIYNATQLKTKYQRVTVGLSGWPQAGASNWIYARSNSTGSTAIAARIYLNTFLLFFNISFTVELYSVSSNSYSLIESTTTALPGVNSTWTLQCGTDNTPNGLNTYRVLCDGKQVISRTYYGAADGGNYTGFGMESGAFIVPQIPASVTSFGAWDNIGQEYLGCGFRAARGTTTVYAVQNTGNDGALLPAGIFTSIDIPVSSGLTLISNSEIKVSVGGWYMVNITLTITNSFNIRPSVFLNGTVHSTGTWANPACSTFLVYAKPNDIIQAGYNVGLIANVTGNGNGDLTHWSLTFLGNKLPSNPASGTL